MPVYCSRIARRVRIAEKANNIAGLKIASGESHLGPEGEASDREHADGAEGPGGEAFDRTSVRLS